MNRKFSGIMIFLLLFALTLPIQVFAADNTTAEVPFKVNIALGTTVTMMPLNGAPAPEQAAFTDVSEGKFEIKLSSYGTYYYSITQTGIDSNVEYDDTVYNVAVFWGWDEEGNKPYTFVEIMVDGDAHKHESVDFENIANEPSEPSQPSYPGGNPPQTGDNSNIGLLITVMLASLMGMIICIIVWKKKNQEEGLEEKNHLS